ncbi:unnamed protein product [Chrysodeixis includens]|uniref:EF-hand domain-containing protein n=1 Tax=Chrysodeixis includens TaxID=689277 RepID=A0A9N8Q009_CHRIL|nr:unnamed protein product [Chrysodeixis includens]
MVIATYPVSYPGKSSWTFSALGKVVGRGVLSPAKPPECFTLPLYQGPRKIDANYLDKTSSSEIEIYPLYSVFFTWPSIALEKSKEGCRTLTGKIHRSASPFPIVGGHGDAFTNYREIETSEIDPMPNSLDLLERIFRLFDVDTEEHLVQNEWLEYLKERLTEEKQIDFVEQVESVAYVLCGNGVIKLDTFQQILKNKVVTSKLFRVVDTDGDGYATADEIMEFLSTVTSSRPRVGFDKHSVDRLEKLFRETVGDEKEITREQFQKIVVSKNPFFTERVFQIFDEDDSGAISLQEFIAAVHRFAGQTPEDKIRFLFKVYDLDGEGTYRVEYSYDGPVDLVVSDPDCYTGGRDGLIQHRELQHVMRACMEENGMQFSDDQLLELTTAMFEDADTEHRGAITYEALKKQLSNHDGLLENLSISIDRWLVPPKEEPKKPVSLLQRLYDLKPYQLSLPYFRNNYVYLSYLAVFFTVNFVLFVARCVEYRHANGYTILARACGQCLNFNCAWVLVLMLRNCLTQLRVRGCSSFLPLDHHIYLHKLTGVLIVLYSALHTAMHLCNFSLIVIHDPKLNAGNYTLAEWLLTQKPRMFGLVAGCANPTGIALAVILLVMFVCSQTFIRRGGSFEVFYWSHLLYVPFWLLLLFHGPNFWKWFVVPGTIYLSERIMRLVWMRIAMSSGHYKKPRFLSLSHTHYSVLIMNTTITLLLCFLLAVDARSPRDYYLDKSCGEKLTLRIIKVCNSSKYLPSSYQGQKRATWMDNKDTYLQLKEKRLIVDECCENPCSDAYIDESYCEYYNS